VDKRWEENEHKLLEFLDRFPKNCIYMRWNYSTPQTPGNSKAMEWFTEHELQVMGATAGQTRWVLMPQNQSNMDNIKTFAQISIDNGLEGLLLTLWDDQSPHFELYKRGIIAFAEYTWSGTGRTNQELKEAYRQREFSSSLAGDQYAFIDRLEKQVAFWDNALLTGNHRDHISHMDNPEGEAIIDLPDPDNKSEWTAKHAALLEQAAGVLQDCDSILLTIGASKSRAVRNAYTLELYEQVASVVRISLKTLMALQAYDTADSEQEETEALSVLAKLPGEFTDTRQELEEVYGQTRILEKPPGYLLDQDQHHHLANQSISFDWQFLVEILFLEKLEEKLLSQ
jgi:hexosaminidase